MYLSSLSLQPEFYSHDKFSCKIFRHCHTDMSDALFCGFFAVVHIINSNTNKLKDCPRFKRQSHLLWGDVKNQQLSAVICSKELKWLLDSRQWVFMFQRWGTCPRWGQSFTPGCSAQITAALRPDRHLSLRLEIVQIWFGYICAPKNSHIPARKALHNNPEALGRKGGGREWEREREGERERGEGN